MSLELKIHKEGKIVTKIIDGDTIIVEGGKKVRLIGIDCDERGEKCYLVAKEKIKELVLNREVFLEEGLDDKDVYGRDLRYIFLNGENINLKLVEEGFCVARFEKEGEQYQKEIIHAEAGAIKNNRGCKWEE